MKKQRNAHRVPKRKKKTRAEQTHQNRSKKMQHNGDPKAKLPMWEDLNQLKATCQSLLQTVLPVASLFTNKELLTAMGDDVTKLRDMAAALDRDVKEHVTAFNEIAKLHEGKTGLISDGNEIIVMFDIGEKYQRWSEIYENVVVPMIADIFVLANKYLPDDQKIRT